MSDADNPLFLMGMQIGALMSAVSTATMRLAKHHGGRDGPWLDDLEKEMIRDIKDATFSDGVAMQTEMAFQDAGIQAIRNAMAATRKRLADQ